VKRQNIGKAKVMYAMHKIAYEDLKRWIESFNKRVAEYNEWVRAFSKNQARSFEHWEALQASHEWLANEWVKLNKELNEAAERFGPQKIREFSKQIIVPENPRLPKPPPGYTYEQALNKSSRMFIDPYHTKSPLPFKVKLKHDSLMHNALKHIKNNWRPLAYNTGVTLAGASLAALIASLVKKYLDKWQDPTNQIHDNQEPLITEPVEKTSSYIHIPPVVPYITG
jgi:hypothetical protein